MKIGVCTNVDVARMRLAKEIGYDFVETNSENLVKATDEEVEAMKNAGIPILSSNCFIGLKLFGSERASEEEFKNYLAKLFARASYLGIECLVFGSSRARRRPDDMSLEEVKAQMADFIKKYVVPNCEKYNIKIAIEPLRKEECNWLNLVENGVEIAELVGSPYINVLCDVKHMADGSDSFENITKYADRLIHAHTSNPLGDETHKRIYPAIGDSFNQDAFILPVKRAGITTVAIEADVIDFEQDARRAYEVLKSYR